MLLFYDTVGLNLSNLSSDVLPQFIPVDGSG